MFYALFIDLKVYCALLVDLKVFYALLLALNIRHNVMNKYRIIRLYLMSKLSTKCGEFAIFGRHSF